ncbi:MAG: hypothetical protein GX260_02280 [Tissierellia bacterium]|jgi:hypothetical protein|nr:hypothetical protein [Tissierellia bacterium]
MNRKKRCLTLLLGLTLLIACRVPYEKIAIDRTRSYILSMNNRDIGTQMKLLEAFSPKREAIESFLSYVIEATERSLQVVHEDRQVIIVRAHFFLRLKDDYPRDGGFSPGNNEVTRYFAYYKNRDMQLREILEKLIK